ncbi:hypothetical protein SAMN04488109_0646 [Chryseolinea serpens]|uniref:Por secretion system C-terminal sorting domain-containing protein n=1 Tax=Chryseolinea serpens TaxID=947013 RepID=A0A1M5KHI6_9BACT|nr:hypothetical protein [Chryseolinea serpens]SHG52175.1 hypothetical protein SAMN04488109_0646 [Chryseolinea serpens]
MIYQSLFIRIFLILLLATPLYCQATDVPIKIHITDKESGAPIQGYKVSLTTAYFGNATAAIKPIATLGLTDDCGNLTATAPLDKANFAVHGMPVDSTFILLFEHCAYGQFYKEVPAFGPVQAYEVSKPFVYELKVSTDDSKSFIKLDWKAHNSTIPVYVASGYTDFIKGEQLHITRSVDGSPAADFVYTWTYTADETGSFVDTDVNPVGNHVYVYGINPTKDYRSLPGCSSTWETISLTLNSATPASTTILPTPVPDVSHCVVLAAEKDIYQNLDVFPIPYEDRITVKPDEKIGRAFSLTVSSVLGQQLYSIQNPTLSQSGELILDLSVLPAGLQILELRTKTSRQVVRISKVR